MLLLFFLFAANKTLRIEEAEKKGKSLEKQRKTLTSNNSKKNAIKMTSESNFRAAAVDNGMGKRAGREGVVSRKKGRGQEQG